jgi:hypothetical protein
MKPVYWLIGTALGVLMIYLLLSDEPPPSATVPPDIMQSRPQGAMSDSAAELNDGRPAAAQFATQCDDSPASGITVVTKEELRAAEQDAVTVLQASGDAEHLLSAALLSRYSDPLLALELLDQSVELSSNAPLSAWTAFVICGQRPNLNCNLAEREATAIAVDSKNGAMWVQIAALRLEKGRDAAAIDAMRRAVAAPDYSSFYAEQIMHVERGLASATNLGLADRFMLGVSFASVSPFAMNTLTSQCESEQTGVWPELCEQLGRRMATDAKDIMNRSLGLSLQKLAMTNLGDAEGLLAVQQQQQDLRRLLGTVESNRVTMNLLGNDERVLRDYMSNLEVFGETVAMDRLSAEAARLKELPDYDQCNFEGDPYSIE